MKAKRKKRNFSEKLLAWRYGLVKSYIERGEKVLDLGAGTGWVGQRIADEKDCDVTLVDVIDCNETDLPHRVYGGKKLPYDDDSFDVTILIFVLHHTSNQEEILQEAARVTRRRIIIVEDTPRNAFELSIDKLCDTVMSLQHGFSNPANYRRIEEWQEIFKRLDLRLVSQDAIKPFFPFYYLKTVFVLDLDRARA